MDGNCEVSDKSKSLNERVKTWKFWKPIVSATLGGLLGFLYYFFVGCTSGTCAITSSPYNSIIMGAILGLLITNSPCSQNSCSR